MDIAIFDAWQTESWNKYNVKHDAECWDEDYNEGLLQEAEWREERERLMIEEQELIDMLDSGKLTVDRLPHIRTY